VVGDGLEPAVTMGPLHSVRQPLDETGARRVVSRHAGACSTARLPMARRPARTLVKRTSSALVKCGGVRERETSIVSLCCFAP